MALQDRILEVVKYSGLSVRALANKLGLKTSQTLYELIKGNTKTLSYGVQCAILNTFPEINKVWLVMGQGEMLNSPQTTDATTSEQDGFDLVPLVPLGAHAAQFSDFSTEGIVTSKCERVVSPIKGCDLAIDVSGDSMEPDFPNGCRVFVKK